MDAILSKIKFRCPNCHGHSHDWHPIHVEQNSTLRKMESTYISWCSTSGQYVLQSLDKEMLSFNFNQN